MLRLTSSAAPSATASAYSQNCWMCCPWYGLSLLNAAFIYILCRIIAARALFTFIMLFSPLFKQIASNQIAYNLRRGTIMCLCVFHQTRFVFSWNADCQNVYIIHYFHSFHLYVKMMMNCINGAARKSFRPWFSGEYIIIPFHNLGRNRLYQREMM